MSPMECTRLHDLAPEVALGLLDGAERAEVLAHLERCATCQADVASLTEIGEQLLLLAPEVPPPAGFETRVLERVTTLPGPTPALPLRARRRRWRPLAAVAAVLLLVVAFAGLLRGMSGEDHPDVAATAAMENADGATIGAVNLLKGSPPTLEVDLADWVNTLKTQSDLPPGPWTLRVVDQAGARARYAVPADDATPEVTLDHGHLGTIHTVTLLDRNGDVWCTGTFE